MTPKKISLHHIAIMVKDLETAMQFYRTLGFEEIETPHSAYKHGIRWLRMTDGVSLHINEVPPPESIERIHFAISVSDINEWRKYVTDQHLYIKEQSVELHGINRFFLSDPSDNLIEFIQVEVIENKGYQCTSTSANLEAKILLEKH